MEKRQNIITQRGILFIVTNFFVFNPQNKLFPVVISRERIHAHILSPHSVCMYVLHSTLVSFGSWVEEERGLGTRCVQRFRQIIIVIRISFKG